VSTAADALAALPGYADLGPDDLILSHFSLGRFRPFQERVRAAAEQLKVQVELDEPYPPVAVLGDRRQLTSAIYNLLENGVKFSQENSEVRCTGRVVGEEVLIEVSDHGVGIPARDLERIFERFYRVDQGRSRQTGGTGLGLAIVRHVAANHRGSVQVESREGEGSTFTVRLPLQPRSDS